MSGENPWHFYVRRLSLYNVSILHLHASVFFLKFRLFFCHTRIFSSYQSSLISGGTEQADISCDKRHTWSYSLIQGYKQTTFVNACKTGWTIQRVRIDHHCSRGWARQSWFGEGELLRKFSAAQHKHKTRGMNMLSRCSSAWDLPQGADNWQYEDAWADVRIKENIQLSPSHSTG